MDTNHFILLLQSAQLWEMTPFSWSIFYVSNTVYLQVFSESLSHPWKWNLQKSWTLVDPTKQILSKQVSTKGSKQSIKTQLKSKSNINIFLWCEWCPLASKCPLFPTLNLRFTNVNKHTKGKKKFAPGFIYLFFVFCNSLLCLAHIFDF